MQKNTSIDFFSLQVRYKQTELSIKTAEETNHHYVKEVLKHLYLEIEQYISLHNDFLTTLHPCEVSKTAPPIIRHMSRLSRQANVGPMAGIAGAIAQYVGERLSPFHRQIICNNGGDIYYKTTKEQQFIINAPGSPFNNKIKICVPPSKSGKGLCTSSGTSGHSINMGRSYAVTILACDACLADIWATAISNMIMTYQDIEKGLSYCKKQKGIQGTIILVGKHLGLWGNISIK